MHQNTFNDIKILVSKLSRKMHGIFFTINRILRYFKKHDFLHTFALTALIALSILSVYSIVIVISDKLSALEFNLCDDEAFKTFFFLLKITNIYMVPL
jgi:hypothetical protein